MKLVQTLALSLVIAAVSAPSFAKKEEEKVSSELRIEEAAKAEAAEASLAGETGKVENK